MTIEISHAELYKIMIHNKDLFRNISDEITNFIYYTDASCGGCHYKKIEQSFVKLVNRNKRPIENTLFVYFKSEVNIR